MVFGLVHKAGVILGFRLFCGLITLRRGLLPIMFQRCGNIPTHVTVSMYRASGEGLTLQRARCSSSFRLFQSASYLDCRVRGHQANPSPKLARRNRAGATARFDLPYSDHSHVSPGRLVRLRLSMAVASGVRPLPPQAGFPESGQVAISVAVRPSPRLPERRSGTSAEAGVCIAYHPITRSERIERGRQWAQF
jgi:hypothetical protein